MSGPVVWGLGYSRFLPQLSPTDDPESVYIYDLMATVVHILDSRTGGSLVGHIKVGETYHQRKEVRPCRTPTGSREPSRGGDPSFPAPFPGLSVECWLNVPGSPEQPRAAGAPHGEGRAEETLFPHPLRLVPPGHGHRASLSLYFQVRAGTSSPFPRKGLVWAVLSSAGDAQARNSQSVSRLHAWLLSLASPWSFGRELGRARSPSSPILSRPLSPPGAAGISLRCPRKGGGSHMASSHPPFAGNGAEESLLWPGGAP